MSAWFSLPQQWLMTTWNKQTATILAQKSVTVLWYCYRSKDKIPRALKRFVCKLLQFLLRIRFCWQNWYYAQLYTSSISRYFLFITMPQKAKKGKILRWNKHAGQQADPVSVHRLQTDEKPRDKMHIHLGMVVVQPTVVQNSFHTEFLFSFFEDENGQEIFLCFCREIKKS